MTVRAIIMIPTQGKHVRHFLQSATELKKAVYRSQAIIVKTIVALPKGDNPNTQGSDDYSVKFVTEKGKSFSFKDLHDDRHKPATVAVISHAASDDGPNLAFGAGGYQPWGGYEPMGMDGNPYVGPRVDRLGKFYVEMLRPRSQKFWSEVGRSLDANGKIIFLGCNLGTGDWAYVNHVANASGHATYGPDGQCSAGDWQTVVRLVKSIERGHPDTLMKKAEPMR